MISKSFFSPITSLLLLIFSVLRFRLYKYFYFNKILVEDSIVFVTNNTSSGNVLSSLASSLCSIALDQGLSSYTIDASKLHRYRLAGTKIVFMHWALAHLCIFYRHNNKTFLWYSHTRLNVFPYLPFLPLIDNIFFQNALDACLIKSHLPMLNSNVFPGILHVSSHQSSCPSVISDWHSRKYDVCLYIAMNSLGATCYYNNRKYINYTFDLALELSKSFAVNLLLNKTAYQFFSNSGAVNSYSNYQHLHIELRNDFPDNLCQFASSRYFVNSSLIEGGPISILESITAGCLPISSLYSMASSIPELVDLGLLFDINLSPARASLRVKDIISRDIIYTEAIERLSSAASQLTEHQLVQRISLL